MSHKNSSHSSSLFLLELILAILFFSIASAVCVQLFVKSHLLTRQAEVLSVAVNECSDAAEIILSSDSEESMLKKLSTAYPNIKCNDRNLTIPCDESYELKIQYDISATQNNSNRVTAYISFASANDGELVYELDISHELSDNLLQEEVYE